MVAKGTAVKCFLCHASVPYTSVDRQVLYNANTNNNSNINTNTNTTTSIDWRENTIAWSFANPPFCNLQPPNTNYHSLHFPQKPTAEALGGAARRLLRPRVSGSRVTKHQKKAKAMSCQSMSQFQRRPKR